MWEAANRDDLFSVTSLKHFPYVANSDFHEPKHLYSWKTLGCLTVQPRDVDAGTTMDQQSPLPDISSERFAEALRRAQAEFREMPGLKLTEAQAARLLSFDSALCSAVLTTLVDRHFLMRTRNTFQRA